MKKNLLFALSIFALTVSGLLVFCENSDSTTKKETIEHQTIQEDSDQSIAELAQ